MATIITGLFESQNQAAKIKQDLEKAGIRNEDYIIYLHDETLSNEVKTSIWRSFFEDSTVVCAENLVVSVRVREVEDRETIMDIFYENSALHLNFFENIKFQDAQSLNFLRRIVSLRAKSQIFSAAEVRKRDLSSGINSELSFG